MLELHIGIQLYKVPMEAQNFVLKIHLTTYNASINQSNAMQNPYISLSRKYYEFLC